MSAVITTSKLSKRYGSQLALHDLSLEVHSGEVLGYLGPNGAGKTTTIRLLLGLISASSGSATIFGLDVHSQAPTSNTDILLQFSSHPAVLRVYS